MKAFAMVSHSQIEAVNLPKRRLPEADNERTKSREKGRKRERKQLIYVKNVRQQDRKDRVWTYASASFQDASAAASLHMQLRRHREQNSGKAQRQTVSRSGGAGGTNE